MPSLKIHNKRMLQLMKHLIEIGEINRQYEFFEDVKCQYGNMPKIKNGTASFTIEQCINACKKYKTSMNYLCGFSNEMIPKKTQQKTAKELIKEALELL